MHLETRGQEWNGLCFVKVSVIIYLLRGHKKIPQMLLSNRFPEKETVF